MLCEVSRITIALGSVTAAVGFTLLGMGMGFAETDDDLVRLSVILMVVGVVATIVGAVIYRTTHEPADERPSRGEDAARVGPTGEVRR
jgi:multisubunit Na+/H+ antiporter MnhG subunit